MILILIATLLLCQFAQNRVIEITTTNVQLVLKTVDKLHLLLHNPTCQHSKDYAQKFLEVKTQYSLGITDCQREKLLCDHLNVTHFPALLQLTNTSMLHLDEQQFLRRQGLVNEDDPRVILNNVVKRLKGDQKWVAVVLQEEGLPVLDKINQSKEKGIFYVSPPSRLYTHLSAIVGKKIGCWIISTKEDSFDKYYCGNGYKSQQLEKYLKNFVEQRLVKHIFSRQTNNSYMLQAQLSQIIKNKYSVKKCMLVYFYSKQCEHCSIADVKKIDNLLTELKIKQKFTLQIYDIDHEELPINFKIRRVPQLVEFCKSTMIQYGQIFNLEYLTKFLTRQKKTKKDDIDEWNIKRQIGQGFNADIDEKERISHPQNDQKLQL